MEKRNPRLLNVIFGLFFSSILKRPDKLSNKITEKYSYIFDEIPINLPVPEDILDFPVTQLLSKSKTWKLEISRKRANIIFEPKEEKNYSDIEDEVGKIKEMMKVIVTEAKNGEEKTEIERLTNISSFIYEVENPNEFLRDKFLSDKETEFKELKIAFNKPQEFEDILCNDITNYQIIKRADNNKEQILIQRDFNTDISKKTFTDEEIDKFWKIAEENSHFIRI